MSQITYLLNPSALYDSFFVSMYNSETRRAEVTKGKYLV